MLGALIIVFREVIEAGLIVGIVMAVTKGVRGSRATIVAGVAAGVVGASLVAFFAGLIANALAGVGQEIFNASILLVAVVMLIWHNIWMASHGRELAADVKRVGDAVRTGSRSVIALGVVCAVAVMREGSEVALFMYGLVASGGSTALELIAGAVLGLLAGVAVTAVTYLGLVTIPPRRLFTVTTLLVSFLAAGLAAQAAQFLQQAGVATALDQTAWDTSAILSDTSLFGRVLHTLIGYSDQPSALQVVVYLATLAIIVVLTKIFASRSAPPPKALGPTPAE
ncbi:MAG: FTR1 family protein [Roseiarcus sp.]|jgi:high-affinity iron transporter|uniref:FTR1 family iron permease n=1 Tax=Roseiarcus sp. TaxID=1969460 RepID=UPI003BAEA9C5